MTCDTWSIRGHVRPGGPDWIHVPVPVPDGANRITVGYEFTRPEANVVDLGVFDERGVRTGFRGWSGGSRPGFTISAGDATPGYLPGPVRPGVWHVLLGPYRVVPDGLDWTVSVAVDRGPEPAPFQPSPAPDRAAGRGRAGYRGDTHLHTVHSDGARTPPGLLAAARRAGLDFVVSTEHNTCSAAEVWGRYTDPGLLVVDGMEVTTRDGHCLALGLPPGHWIDWRGTDVVDRIHRAGALAVAAHPFVDKPGCSWPYGFDGLDAIEVWNGDGSWSGSDQAAVDAWDRLIAAGRWIPAIGGSDAHREPEPVGCPHNVVRAADLSRDAILAGIRGGQVWIAGSAAVRLSFAAWSAGRRAGVGERLAARPDDPVTVRAAVAGAPGTEVTLIDRRGIRAAGNGAVSWITTAGSRYVRAEVRQPDGAMVALTNPIIVDPFESG